MLKFAIKYHVAIDAITTEHSMKLCNYELRKEEWKVAKELCEVLKVHSSTSHSKTVLTIQNHI